MADIPIAQIPNAPGAGQGPALIRPGGTNINLGTAQSLLTQTINTNAFAGSGAGLSAIGQALSDVGDAGQAVSATIEKKQQVINSFQDDVSLATYDRLIGEEFAKYRGEMEGQSEDKWLPGWQERFGKLSPEITSTLAFSPEGQQKLAIYNQRTLGNQNIQLITASSQKAVERGTGELLAMADRQAAAGDLEGVSTTVAKLVTTGALRADQGQAKVREVQMGIWEGQVNQAIVNNPRAVQADMEDSLKTGKPPAGAPWMKDKTMQRQYRDKARSEGNNMEVEARREATDLIMGRKITDPKQLRAQYGDMLGETTLASLEKAMAKEISYNPETISKIRTKIAAADFGNDIEMKSFNELANELDTQVPERLRGPLSSELYQTWSSTVRDGKSKTPDQKFAASILEQFDKFGDSGLFGDNGTSVEKGRKKIVDPEKHAQVWEKVETSKEQMRAWLKANPKANPEEARKQFSAIVGKDAADSAAKAFEEAQQNSSWWGVAVDLMDSAANGSSEPRYRIKPKRDLAAEVDAELNLPTDDEPDLTQPVDVIP